MKNPPIIVAGSGRSGTTWVLDVIAQTNNLRTVFEPLHPIGCPKVKPFANKYVRDGASEPELKLFMDKVLTGTLPSLWANYRVRPDRLRFRNLQGLTSFKDRLKDLYLNYKRLLIHYERYRRSRKFERIIVKFIRANLMLGWLSKNYHAKIIFIVRHPCAIIASKLRLGGPNWSHEGLQKIYMEDRELWNDYLHRFKKIITSPCTEIEGHTFVWCIENVIPFTCCDKNNVLTVFYEDLIINGQNEWKRIFDFLDLNGLPEIESILRPSQQTSRDMKDKIFDSSQLRKWTQAFTRDELSAIDRILNLFQVSFYSAWEPKPIVHLQEVKP